MAECDDKEHSDTPRVDALDYGDQRIFANGDGYGQLWALARQLERELSVARSALVPQDLIHAARNAEAKLSYLGKSVFGHPAFTDRYQDSPSCIAMAEKLRRALDAAISNSPDRTTPTE